MSDPRAASKRAPQAFELTDPAVITEPAADTGPAAPPMQPRETSMATQAAVKGARGFRPGWGTVLLGALAGLASLAAGIAFTQAITAVLERNDWVGIAGWALLALAGVAATVIVLREWLGLMRLGRLAHLRREAEEVLRTRDAQKEKVVVRYIRSILAGKPELAWAAARYAEHEADVRDPGDLMALADRELIAPLDREARRLILSSAKRVALVTAMSPIVFVAMTFVLVENIGLLRRLATLYGGRPGALGGLKLARMVFVHILATGGVALTDDLISQFIGQDLARRLSRRLGEGLFNGAMTARVGVAAIEICRPLPYVEAKPVRIRDILVELTRRKPAAV